MTKLSLQLTNKYKSLIIGKKTSNKLIEQDELVTIVVCLISNVFCSCLEFSWEILSTDPGHLYLGQC